ncbi:pyruvate kinase [Candidatus Woesebacteria bacterium]|nr:pyruvate kinase [Candidatus Woesebacteria bacterium]
MQKKLTKIVATIGPASDTPDMITTLIKHGVNIFRFNFKHNSIDWHGERIQRVNAIAKKLHTPVGTLIDLQGPEIRIVMNTEKLDLTEGDTVTIHSTKERIKGRGFTLTHPTIIPTLKNGDTVIADDGTFVFTVIKSGDVVTLQSQSTGILKDHKSINIPNGTFDFPLLVDRDFEGLKLAALHEIDFVALSFVRSAKDVHALHKEMAKYHVDAHIISKIETQLAIENIDEIIDISDGIMIARGDLGVEAPIERVPYYQKTIIQKCIQRQKTVITATQMLESMIEHPRPTRAEVSDVANAVYDWTDCTMLSAESAAGSYPIEAVDLMTKTFLFYEKKIQQDIRHEIDIETGNETAMIAATAYDLYIQHQTQLSKTNPLQGFMIFTQSGRSVSYLSRFRPRVPIFAFTPFSEVRDKLTMLYGVYPFINKTESENVVTLKSIIREKENLVRKEYLSPEARLIVLHGQAWAKGKGLNCIRII